jgi:thioredoxin-related protein
MKTQTAPILNFALIAGLLMFTSISCTGQPADGNKATAVSGEQGIQWLSFEDAVAKSQQSPKKMFIDVYTSWCGWCKKMDASTFMEPEVVKYINDNYYPVKLNAETKDTIRFQGKEFKYIPEYKSNEIAISLLSGKMGYPSYVFLDESYTLMSGPVQGFLQKNDMMAYLTYFGAGLHTQQEFEVYREGYLKNLPVK